MKSNCTSTISFRTAAAILAGALVCFGQAEAKKGKKGPANKGRAAMFDPGELGATKGKFETWKREVLGGGAFYTKADQSLKTSHSMICSKVRQAMLDGRTGDEAGWKIIDKAISLGVASKEHRGDADALTESQRKAVSDELQKIATMAKAENLAVDQKLLTPTLNRRQVTTGELLRFGKTAKMISTAEAGTLERKVDRLLEKEEKAKSDGEVTDRERESLIEDAQELSRDLVKALAR